MTNSALENDLKGRSNSLCELCGSGEDLDIYEVPPEPAGDLATSLLLCGTCRAQLANPDQVDSNHWRCLNDSMWSQVPAVQVVAWRMLNQLSSEGWPRDLLEMLYLDEETQHWAEALSGSDSSGGVIEHRDSNGALLEAGDSVTLTKDLNVKGANFTAKRGTTVKNITLVSDNPEHIEGKISGQRIVILTRFVKKAN
jgi:protein PhnA